MSITIQEALSIEELKEFKIIAGEAGIENEIKKVGILDYEKEELIEENFVEGEFAITTLVAIKDNVEELYELVKKMISVGVSGLAIKNIYFNDLPNKIIDLANGEKFPIMIFSKVYFEDIITSVMNAIKEKEKNETLALKIDNILYSNLDTIIIKKIAYEINRNFREKNIVAFCKKKDNEELTMTSMYTNMEKDKHFKVMPYKDGYLFINTFEDIGSNEFIKVISTRLENMGFSSDKYIIGVSSLYNKLGELNHSIKESLYAFKYSIIYKKDISFFNKIGTNKMFIPLIDNPWILKYHDNMIEPLIVYDKRNDMELLKTAIKYIENNGDIKATAKELFQHSNTIRYRIDKVNKILSQNCDSEHFYEELSVAIRIHNLLNISL